MTRKTFPILLTALILSIVLEVVLPPIAIAESVEESCMESFDVLAQFKMNAEKRVLDSLENTGSCENSIAELRKRVPPAGSACRGLKFASLTTYQQEVIAIAMRPNSNVNLEGVIERYHVAVRGIFDLLVQKCNQRH